MEGGEETWDVRVGGWIFNLDVILEQSTRLATIHGFSFVLLWTSVALNDYLFKLFGYHIYSV